MPDSNDDQTQKTALPQQVNSLAIVASAASSICHCLKSKVLLIHQNYLLQKAQVMHVLNESDLYRSISDDPPSN